MSYQQGWTANQEAMSNDWALLKIDSNLGDQTRYGHMGWRSLNFSNPDTLSAVKEKIKLGGYSGDFPTDRLTEFGIAGDTAGVDVSCSILEASQGMLFHDCDTNPGASGSAIFAQFDDDNYYILGLHAGGFPLNQTIRLPDGVATDIVNRDVEVSQWATQATAMQR